MNSGVTNPFATLPGQLDYQTLNRIPPNFMQTFADVKDETTSIT